MRKWPRRRKWFLGVVLLLAVLVAFDYATFPLLSSKPTARFDKGSNGIWLRYPWYFGEHSEAEITELATRLEKDRFRYAFFHIRDAKPDGSLRYPHFPEAAKLNSVFQSASPAVKRIAWFYVGNSSGRGAVNLSDVLVRKKLISEATQLITEGGFEGIQWDYEICDDGDANLIALLRESRDGLPKGTWQGAAVPVSYSWPLAGFGWSPEYVRRVAEQCDQLSVMAYDSAMLHPRAYSMLVSRQIKVFGEALKGLACQFLIGLPTYEEGSTFSHNPKSENLDVGMHSVRGALEDEVPERFEGIALFADYTMDEREWQSYRSVWLGR